MSNETEIKKTGPFEIEVPVWIGHGTGRLIRRSALPASHPESEYNYVLKNYKVDPTLYGIESPYPKCPTCKQDIVREF